MASEILVLASAGQCWWMFSTLFRHSYLGRLPSYVPMIDFPYGDHMKRDIFVLILSVILSPVAVALDCRELVEGYRPLTKKAQDKVLSFNECMIGVGKWGGEKGNREKCSMLLPVYELNPLQEKALCSLASSYEEAKAAWKRQEETGVSYVSLPGLVMGDFRPTFNDIFDDISSRKACNSDWALALIPVGAREGSCGISREEWEVKLKVWNHMEKMKPRDAVVLEISETIDVPEGGELLMNLIDPRAASGAGEISKQTIIQHDSGYVSVITTDGNGRHQVVTNSPGGAQYGESRTHAEVIKQHKEKNDRVVHVK